MVSPDLELLGVLLHSPPATVLEVATRLPAGLFHDLECSTLARAWVDQCRAGHPDLPGLVPELLRAGVIRAHQVPGYTRTLAEAVTVDTRRGMGDTLATAVTVWARRHAHTHAAELARLAADPETSIDRLQAVNRHLTRILDHAAQLNSPETLDGRNAA